MGLNENTRVMIFFLFGEDTLRSRERRRALIKKFKREVDPSGLNLATIDGGTVEPDVLARTISAQPFLARRRMVVIDRLFENKNHDVLAVIERLLDSKIESANDDTIVVLWEDGAPTNKLAKRLADSPQGEHFSGLDVRSAARWAMERAKTLGVTLDARAAQLLSERFPGNPWALATELHKLCAYAKTRIQDSPPKADPPLAERFRIQEMDVNTLTGNFAEAPIYALSNAIEAGSLKDAAAHAQNFLGAGTSILALVATLTKLFSGLLATKRDSIAHLKLHPYVQRKMASIAHRIPTPALTETAEALLNLEHKLKTTRLNGEVAFLRFLMRATTALTSASRHA